LCGAQRRHALPLLRRTLIRRASADQERRTLAGTPGIASDVINNRV